MKKYEIYEGNFERLTKKLQRIENKCKKYGCAFHFEQVGEAFHEVTDEATGKTKTLRYIEVEVEGTAQINGWRFVATIDHTEAGNVIRQFDETVQIPEKYRHTDPICEHCQTARRRKDTFLIYNEETHEFKQVGRSCLLDYTGGWSSEDITRYISWFDSIIGGYDVSSSGFGSYETYYPVEDMLASAVACVNKLGYHNSQSDDATRDIARSVYKIANGSSLYPRQYHEYIEGLIREKDIDITAENVVTEAKAARAWILAEEVDEYNSYMNNLKVICSSEYCSYRNLGYLVSLIPTYFKHLETEAARAEREAKRAKAASQSKHVGKIKDRLTFDATAYFVTACDSYYGWSALYKFVTEDGDVFTWWTGSDVDVDRDRPRKVRVTGTVKDHDEYAGVKQTVLTRCKIVYLDEEDAA